MIETDTYMRKIFLPLLLALLTIGFIPVILSSCDIECAHEYLTANIVAPTCDTEGYTSNTCVKCSKEFKTNYTQPTGHTITETVFAPTCSEEGYTYYSCPCGYNYKANNLHPTGHTYTSAKTEVTCASAGYTEYTCTVCGHSYKGDFVSATGHDMKKTVYPPTKDKVGYTEYVCSVCSHSYQDDFEFYSDAYGGGTVVGSSVVAKGIDVSKHQNAVSGSSYSSLNWNAIRSAGVDFAILRAGYIDNKDPVFDMNYDGAKAAGIAVGAYFYSYASDEAELDEEISQLLGWLEGKQFEYPIYLDIEDKSLEDDTQKEILTRVCMKFVTVMRENGYYGAIYTNNRWLSNYLYGDALKGFCDIWYSRYPHLNKVTLEDKFEWNTAEYGDQLSM